MNIFELCLLFLSLIGHGQGRLLWSVELPEVSDLVLEKNKPLQLSTSYESVQITKLKGTLYSDSLSQLEGVKELRLKSPELTAIEKGALCSAPDVKILELDFYDSENNLTHLTKEMFENCSQLEELLLKFNDKRNYTIDQDAFEDLVNLKNFGLKSYSLYHLTKGFLKLNPKFITDLALFANEISVVDSNVFEDFTNLENLTIRFNKNWTYFPNDLFKNLKKLNSILLIDNGLKDLTWDEFEGLDSVKTLVLSSNQISSFNAEKIAKNLPSLEYLSIQLNPLPCKQAEKFAEDLKKRLDHPIEVEYKFDPGFYDSCKEEN